MVGNLTSLTDAQNKTTGFDHNYRGDVTKITDALLNDTILEYSGAGCGSCGSGVDKLTGVIDANQAGQSSPLKTEFKYDTTGNLNSEIDQLGNTTLYAYYNNGQLHQKIHDVNSDGQVDGGDVVLLSFTYLPNGRLGTKTVRDESGINQLTSFGYDTDGRLWTITSPAINYTYIYYDDGRLEKVIDSNGRAIDYAQYDGIGRPKQVTYFGGTSDQQVMNYVYNATTGALDTISSVAGAFTFTPDNFARRGSLSFPNNITATYSYQTDTGWLTGIDYNNGGTDIVDLSYPLYDKSGNRKQRVEDTVATTYSYDDTYQLTQAATGSSVENYNWDKAGNRTGGPTVKEVPNATYTHDDANRMLQGRKLSYQYDDLGNQTTRTISPGKGWILSWDGENKLKKAELVKDTVTLKSLTFKYDPFGRRIEKKVVNNPDTTPSTTTTTYFYDQEDIVFTSVDDGITVSKTYYVHGPGIDEPLAMIRDGQPSYYHADGLGSIVAITDASGNIVQRYSYEAFGQLTASDPTFDNFYTYTGREYDKETGLYYYRARYYDAMEGRFISKDPIGFAGGSTNLYSYVGNNSVNFIDPSGLDAIYINYDYYPVSTPVGKLPLGHGAVVAVNPETGHTKYYEFGRYGDSNGVVRGSPDIEIPNVVIGSNGLPTTKSLNHLYNFLSRNFGHNVDVSATYYPNSDYQGTIDFAEEFGSNHPDYDLLNNNCKTFGRAAATACQEGTSCR